MKSREASQTWDFCVACTHACALVFRLGASPEARLPEAGYPALARPLARRYPPTLSLGHITPLLWPGQAEGRAHRRVVRRGLCAGDVLAAGGRFGRRRARERARLPSECYAPPRGGDHTHTPLASRPHIAARYHCMHTYLLRHFDILGRRRIFRARGPLDDDPGRE